MKKIIVVVISVLFVFSSFGTVFAGDRGRLYNNARTYYAGETYHSNTRHNRSVVVVRNQRNNPWEVAGAIAGAGIVLIAADRIFNGPRTVVVNQQHTPPQYRTEYDSNAAAQRAQLHERALARYCDCLDERQVDLNYGVSPADAKDCSRLDPANMNWSR